MSNVGKLTFFQMLLISLYSREDSAITRFLLFLLAFFPVAKMMMCRSDFGKNVKF